MSTATDDRPGTPARARLLQAALDAFAEQPVVAVSLDEIRRRAGVSVGALYHHFPDKSALVDALYLDLLESVQEGLRAELRRHPSARGGVEAVVRWYLGWVSRHRTEATVLLGHRPDHPRLRELNRGFFAEVTAWWDIHVGYGTLRDLSRDVVHALWLGPAEEYCRHWLSGRVRRIPSGIADTLADAAWRALRQEQTAESEHP